MNWNWSRAIVPAWVAASTEPYVTGVRLTETRGDDKSVDDWWAGRRQPMVCAEDRERGGGGGRGRKDGGGGGGRERKEGWRWGRVGGGGGGDLESVPVSQREWGMSVAGGDGFHRDCAHSVDITPYTPLPTPTPTPTPTPNTPLPEPPLLLASCRVLFFATRRVEAKRKLSVPSPPRAPVGWKALAAILTQQRSESLTAQPTSISTWCSAYAELKPLLMCDRSFQSESDPSGRLCVCVCVFVVGGGGVCMCVCGGGGGGEEVCV